MLPASAHVRKVCTGNNGIHNFQLTVLHSWPAPANLSRSPADWLENWKVLCEAKFTLRRKCIPFTFHTEDLSCTNALLLLLLKAGYLTQENCFRQF